MEQNVKLSPPWIDYANELVSLFGRDKDIKTEYDDDKKTFRMYVDDTDKANALQELLPMEKDFGGTVLNIMVVPADKSEEPTDAELIKKAFKNNPAVVEIVDKKLFERPVTYVSFIKEVIQYYNDDLGDLHGNKSALLQDIAREIFNGKDGVYFCTDNK